MIDLGEVKRFLKDGEVGMATLAENLDAKTEKGVLYEKLEGDTIRCHACAHRCTIRPGRRGICKVRFNRDGELRVPMGYVASLQVDPVEKKPFYHLMSGSDALTFGMLGCNFHCSYCQNWLSSQALRDPGAEHAGRYIREVSSEDLVRHGQRQGAQVVASSYNEPLITSEWAYQIFSRAKQLGMKTVYVSNGYATPEVLDYLNPVLSGFKVDLKTMRDDYYRSLGGQLDPVLESIELAQDLGLWVEVVTLVVPDYNDSPSELGEIAGFIRSISPHIPWHVTAFHPDYKMGGASRTSLESILQAAEIGRERGLEYVYAGNLPGRVGGFEDTHCHQCGTTIIQRSGYVIREYSITPRGTCPDCGTDIPGLWTEDPDTVNVLGSGVPRGI